MDETTRRGFPGIKSVQELRVVQDGPPPGGFPSVRYGRKLPSTGPKGLTLFVVSAAVISYGFYKVGLGNMERRAIKQEKLAARIALVPVLQAEEDRRWLVAKKRAVAFERELMKDVPGWVVDEPIYKSGRFMPVTPPAFVQP